MSTPIAAIPNDSNPTPSTDIATRINDSRSLLALRALWLVLVFLQFLFLSVLIPEVLRNPLVGGGGQTYEALQRLGVPVAGF